MRRFIAPFLLLSLCRCGLLADDTLASLPSPALMSDRLPKAIAISVPNKSASDCYRVGDDTRASMNGADCRVVRLGGGHHNHEGGLEYCLPVEFDCSAVEVGDAGLQLSVKDSTGELSAEYPSLQPSHQAELPGDGGVDRGVAFPVTLVPEDPSAHSAELANATLESSDGGFLAALSLAIDGGSLQLTAPDSAPTGAATVHLSGICFDRSATACEGGWSCPATERCEHFELPVTVR